SCSVVSARGCGACPTFAPRRTHGREPPRALSALPLGGGGLGWYGFMGSTERTGKMAPVSAKSEATVTFDGRFVTISRGGWRSVLGGKGDRRIPLSSITMVGWKDPGPMMQGFIHFATAGSPHTDSK